jgi:hypothetical protein
MKNFVTHFNLSYLPQGIALYASLCEQVREFCLWIVCMDDRTYDLLFRAKLPNVRVLRIIDYESDEMIRVRKDRTVGEYCWTVTPFMSSIVFSEDPKCTEVTYLDSDLFFYNSKYQSIYHQYKASGKPILITPHGYAPEFDESEKSGFYCVQFLIYARNSSDEVVKNWQRQCIAWCFNRSEDGKFGDQKYLDSWPEEFPDKVHVLDNPGLIQGPWNAKRFPYSEGSIWHMHSLRVHIKDYDLKNWGFEFGRIDRLPEQTKRFIFPRYLAYLSAGFESVGEAFIREYVEILN